MFTQTQSPAAPFSRPAFLFRCFMSHQSKFHYKAIKGLSHCRCDFCKVNGSLTDNKRRLHAQRLGIVWEYRKLFNECEQHVWAETHGLKYTALLYLHIKFKVQVENSWFQNIWSCTSGIFHSVIKPFLLFDINPWTCLRFRWVMASFLCWSLFTLALPVYVCVPPLCLTCADPNKSSPVKTLS